MGFVIHFLNPLDAFKNLRLVSKRWSQFKVSEPADVSIVPAVDYTSPLPIINFNSRKRNPFKQIEFSGSFTSKLALFRLDFSLKVHSNIKSLHIDLRVLQAELSSTQNWIHLAIMRFQDPKHLSFSSFSIGIWGFH
jgi:hypothetical protein